MSSDLLIPILRRRAFLQVHALENSVLAELLFDGQHGLLHFPFTLKLCAFPFLLSFKSCIICEEIKLLKTGVLLRCICLWKNMICDNIQPTHEKVFIDDPVKEV